MAGALIEVLIRLIILAFVAGLIAWLVARAPFIAEPFRAWLQWAIIAVAVLIAILMLLPLLGVRV
jgi:cation transporter-like permease